MTALTGVGFLSGVRLHIVSIQSKAHLYGVGHLEKDMWLYGLGHSE